MITMPAKLLSLKSINCFEDADLGIGPGGIGLMVALFARLMN